MDDKRTQMQCRKKWSVRLLLGSGGADVLGTVSCGQSYRARKSPQSVCVSVRAEMVKRRRSRYRPLTGSRSSDCTLAFQIIVIKQADRAASKSSTWILSPP